MRPSGSRCRARRSATARPAAAAGFALLALLALLLAGATATALLGAVPSVGPVAGRGAAADLERLAAARDALLAYSTVYPELYGPTGAGPGHLPCPDTDDGFRLAGPNPPCGREEVVAGRLPRHVTVGDVRVGLDVDDGRGAPVRYRLAARAANNPARRPLALVRGARDAVAELSLPGRDGSPGVALRIGADALDRAAERRVAAWIAARAASHGGDGTGPDGDDGATPLDAAALVTRRTASATGDGTVLALIDGVPRTRHWFVLDGWTRRFEVRVAPACREAGAGCAWTVGPAGGARTVLERSPAGSRKVSPEGATGRPVPGTGA